MPALFANSRNTSRARVSLKLQYWIFPGSSKEQIFESCLFLCDLRGLCATLLAEFPNRGGNQNPLFSESVKKKLFRMPCIFLVKPWRFHVFAAEKNSCKVSNSSGFHKEFRLKNKLEFIQSLIVRIIKI